jgi:hypothetical protein
MILIFKSIVPGENYTFTDGLLGVHAKNTVFIRRGQVFFVTKDMQVWKLTMCNTNQEGSTVGYC